MSQISKWKAIQNLLNTCFGTGILAMPYAIGVCGWYSFISVFLAFSMATYSGVCLAQITIKSFSMKTVRSDTKLDLPDNTPTDTAISCDYTVCDTADIVQLQKSESDESSDELTNEESESDSDNEIESDKDEKSIFAQISYDALGKYGELYGVISFIGTLLMLDIIVLIQSFELFAQILSQLIVVEHNIALSDMFLFFYLFIFMLPTCFALNWNQVSWISALSNISVSIIVCMLIYLFIRHFVEFNGNSISENYFNEYNETKDINIIRHASQYQNIISLIFYSFLVFTTSIAASAVIPSLTVSLKNQKDMYKVIIITFSIVTIVYVLCGMCGYIVYREYTHVMIINNFFNWPGGWLVLIISLTYFVNLWGSFSIHHSVLCEIIDALIGLKKDSKTLRRMLRTFMLVLQCIIAYVSRNVLAFLFAINGVWSIALGSGLTFLWLLYIGIFWNELSKQSIFIHCCLLIICVGIGVYASQGAVTGLM